MRQQYILYKSRIQCMTFNSIQIGLIWIISDLFRIPFVDRARNVINKHL